MAKERHLKSNRHESWTGLRVEIERVKHEYNLQNDFASLDIHAWQSIKENIWNKFLYQSKSGWIWERLKLSKESIHVGNVSQLIDELIKEEEEVWFFVN